MCLHMLCWVTNQIVSVSLTIPTSILFRITGIFLQLSLISTKINHCKQICQLLVCWLRQFCPYLLFFFFFHLMELFVSFKMSCRPQARVSMSIVTFILSTGKKLVFHTAFIAISKNCQWFFSFNFLTWLSFN